MVRTMLRIFPLIFLCAVAVQCPAQVIQSSYIDLAVPGQWTTPANLLGSHGSEIFYDSASGAIVQISAQAKMLRVGDITKLFQSVGTAGNPQVSALLSAATFPLPTIYIEKAALDLGKGSKPPHMWELKEGDGNPVWFYTSQLFDEYRTRSLGGSSSETIEQFYPSRVLRAENRTISGGDVLIIEAETERAAVDAALKRFKMPPAAKDQKLRYGWIQFAPGGIAAAQGVLSISFAVPANSSLNAENVLNQIASAKLKPM